MTAIGTRLSVSLWSSLLSFNDLSNPYISLLFSQSIVELNSGFENIGCSEEDARLLHVGWFNQAMAVTVDR